MKVIICGAGQVGSSVARYLSSENISVSIIDPSAEVLNDMNNIDILSIQGSATYIDKLEAAGIASADAILAVTRSDEVNMLICQIASSLYNTPLKIARIRNSAYLSSRWKSIYTTDHIPVDVIISPEHEVANYIAANIAYTGGFDMFSLFNNEVVSISTTCLQQSALHLQPLKILSLSHPHIALNMMAVTRGKKTIIPDEEYVFEANDIAHLMLKKEDIHEVLSLFGHQHTDLSRLLIIGGGAVGYSLAKYLEHTSPSLIVKLLESNRERAEAIAPKLKKAIVMHGKGLDTELLLEANIQSTDTVVSVTNDDNVNVLMSLVAKEFNVHRTLSLVNSDMYIPLASSLKVNALIHPHKITILSILKHIRNRQDIRTIHTFPNNLWSLLEIRVQDDVEGNGFNVEEVYKKTYAHIIAVWRNEQLIFPDNTFQVHKSDTLAVLTKPQHQRKVENLFTLQHSFFH